VTSTIRTSYAGNDALVFAQLIAKISPKYRV
jgi:hypothetical protein